MGTHAPLASYSAFKWAGGTLHLAGLVAYDTTLGRVVRGYDDLPAPVAAELATGAPSSDHSLVSLSSAPSLPAPSCR